MACSSPMLNLKEENTAEVFEQPSVNVPNGTQDSENNNSQGIEKLAQLVFQQIAQGQSGNQNQGNFYLFVFAENLLFIYIIYCL